MNTDDIADLKKEFEAMAGPCTMTPEQDRQNEEADDEDIPYYVEELQKKLLSPAIAGVYLTRIDLKRIADDLEESLPIKERKPMLRALMRHTTNKETLREIFDVMNRYVDGRVLIYNEMIESFPASAGFFKENLEKSSKIRPMFDRIVEDFEELEVTDEPMII